MSRPLVLCYHAISPEWSAALAVPPEAFERQIATLLQRGWGTATFTEVVRRMPARKTAVITFDDAFASVKAYAAPVLAALGVRATVFAPTDYVSRRAPLAWPGLAHWMATPDAGELAPMSWEDLGELAELGWEIGSHTHTHPRLTSLSDAAVAAELRRSREECGDYLQREVTSMAYPYGDVDARVMAHARHAGYEGAATLEWLAGRPDRYRYPRIGVYHKDSWTRFSLKTTGWSRSRYGSKLLARHQRHANPA